MSMSFVMHSFIPLGTYGGDILRGAEEEARQHDYQLYFSTAYHNLGALGTGSKPRGIFGETLQGMIYVGEIPADFFREVKKVGIPVVHVNVYPPGEAVDCIMCDNFAASRLAVSWLVELGHRRIACIACEPGNNLSIEERMMGYRQALFDADIPFDPALLLRVDGYMLQHGYAAMERLLQIPFRPTAVFGTVDEVAVGVIQCAKAHGLRVPEDLSVLGVNDLDLAQMCDPPLTTVRIFREEMGRAAVQRLIEVIQNPGERPRRIDVLCELVKRSSCTHPPRHP